MPKTPATESKSLAQNTDRTQIEHTVRVCHDLVHKRLDQALAEALPQYSRSQLTQWIRSGHVTVDADICSVPKKKLVMDQHIQLCVAIQEKMQDAPQPIDFDTVYQDSHLLVINKPAGLVVHPGNGNPEGTLLNGLIYHIPALKHLPRAGLIHRIDKDTTGLLLVAKTLPAYTELVRQLQAHQIKRAYEALVHGQLISGGSVQAPIGRHPNNRLKMAVTPKGKPATTHYRIHAKYPRHTLLDVTLETGRTHQIRVHMRHIQHPIVGDPLYQHRAHAPQNNLSWTRQALHAKQLTFRHPQTQECINCVAPRPEDFSALIAHCAAL